MGVVLWAAKLCEFNGRDRIFERQAWYITVIECLGDDHTADHGCWAVVAPLGAEDYFPGGKSTFVTALVLSQNDEINCRKLSRQPLLCLRQERLGSLGGANADLLLILEAVPTAGAPCFVTALHYPLPTPFQHPSKHL